MIERQKNKYWLDLVHRAREATSFFEGKEIQGSYGVDPSGAKFLHNTVDCSWSKAPQRGDLGPGDLSKVLANPEEYLCPKCGPNMVYWNLHVTDGSESFRLSSFLREALAFVPENEPITKREDNSFKQRLKQLQSLDYIPQWVTFKKAYKEHDIILPGDARVKRYELAKELVEAYPNQCEKFIVDLFASQKNPLNLKSLELKKLASITSHEEEYEALVSKLVKSQQDLERYLIIHRSATIDRGDVIDAFSFEELNDQTPEHVASLIKAIVDSKTVGSMASVSWRLKRALKKTRLLALYSSITVEECLDASELQTLESVAKKLAEDYPSKKELKQAYKSTLALR